MATPANSLTPPPSTNRPIETSKSVFDLDSKGEVTLKKIGAFEPVASAQDFVNRLGNNTELVLKIMNEGLESYSQKQLASNSEIPWKLVEKDENGAEILSDFTGTALTPEKSEQLDSAVMAFARLYFGYQKNMVADNVEKNRAAKAEAKKQGLAMLLSNPAAVEMLKK